MRANLNFAGFWERTGKTYQSIDSRAALMKIGDSWKVALLVLRFSPEDTGAVEAKYRALEQKWDKMLSTAHFRIALDAVNVDDFNSLWEDLRKGEYTSRKLGLVAGLCRSLLNCSLDLFSLENDFPSHSGYLPEEGEWPCFSKSEGKHLEELYKSKELRNELWDAGLVFGERPAPYVLIQEILEVRNYQPGIGFNLLVYAPFLARIEQHIKSDNNCCTIGVEFHEAFDNELRLSCYLEDRQHHCQIKNMFGPLSPSSQESRKSSPYLRLWQQTLELEGLASDDYLNIHLLHCIPENLVIHDLQQAGRTLVQPAQLMPTTNPLLAALQRFAGKDLDAYLDLEQKTNRPQDKFELKVCRILALCGFSVARLGGNRFDILKDRNDPRVERGKCNILAYLEKRNCLLVVECTENLPGDKDARRLLDGCATLEEEVFQGTNVELKPAFFVGSAMTEDKDLKGGRIIDAKDIDDLTNRLSSGESPEQLFSKFFVSSGIVKVGEGSE